jgi:hypothetical protein
MAISIAPTSNLNTMTLVASTEEWNKLVKRMQTDKGYREVGQMLKSYIDKDSTEKTQKVTLPKPQAQQILTFCGISW